MFIHPLRKKAREKSARIDRRKEREKHNDRDGKASGIERRE